MKNVNILFTIIEHKSEIIMMFAKNTNYQKLVCDILAKIIVVGQWNGLNGVDSINPPPYEGYNEKENVKCCCLFN